MSKSKASKIGDRFFRRQQDLLDYCKEMLARCVERGFVDMDDSDFLALILLRHPETLQKVGVGISHFTTADAPEQPSKCFYLHRIDGTSTEFSYRHCVTGHISPGTEVREAFRMAIQEQIREFRDSVLSDEAYRCPRTGNALTQPDSKVTHLPPFSFVRLVDEFLVLEGVNLLDVELEPPADNQDTARLKHSEFAGRWREFHRRKANLCLVSR